MNAMAERFSARPLPHEKSFCHIGLPERFFSDDAATGRSPSETSAIGLDPTFSPIGAARAFARANEDDILATLFALRGIRDAAIVIHGAAGCRAAATALDEPGFARWYSVNLGERDFILDSEKPLREAISRAIREGARVVFVLGTPVLSIDGDVGAPTAQGLGGDEAPVPVLYLNAGASRPGGSPLSGFDPAFRALLRLVETPGERGGFVNVVSVRENARNLAAVRDVLGGLGIEWNVLPCFSTLAAIRGAGRADATISLNADEGEYLGLGLESAFGVPYARLPAPVGLAATGRFVRALGALFGLGEKAEAYVEAREGALREVTAARPLAGKRLFLQLDMALVEGFSGLVRDLGGEVAGIALSNVDLNNRVHLERLEAVADIPATVAVGQSFDASILARAPVDYYVGREQVAFAARHGAIPISLRDSAWYGYEGMRAFAAALLKQPHPASRQGADSLKT
ncbi:MAG: nitrogenase component 1 [Azoarcus sp.]|nr:nitrogenase component 1 [Azoarcus sp.]